ncbi:PREDICTED: myopalladin-like [Chaetura pelagica]|uniref:myopalladin-like n=1 Tax=Chaetura pelagica TaxID=8897 RepID=UPI0005233370|nr:PREDICTED: myopalladin-like [Chaetura pelagica]
MKRLPNDEVSSHLSEEVLLWQMQSPSASLTGSAYGSTPVFTKGLQNIRATKGQLVVFECRIRATPSSQVHWYREYDQIIDSADFRILRKKACSSAVPEEVCTLVITEAFPEDSGIFKCVAENEFGSAASSARLSVSPGRHMSLLSEQLSSREFAAAQHQAESQILVKQKPDPDTFIGSREVKCLKNAVCLGTSQSPDASCSAVLLLAPPPG